MWWHKKEKERKKRVERRSEDENEYDKTKNLDNYNHILFNNETNDAHENTKENCFNESLF